MKAYDYRVVLKDGTNISPLRKEAALTISKQRDDVERVELFRGGRWQVSLLWSLKNRKNI